jgi:hypothetical protein
MKTAAANSGQGSGTKSNARATGGRKGSWQNHKTLPRKEITTALTVDGAAARRGLR